jgi:uncharacterized membrane protein YidH (DUF202 family)
MQIARVGEAAPSRPAYERAEHRRTALSPNAFGMVLARIAKRLRGLRTTDSTTDHLFRRHLIETRHAGIEGWCYLWPYFSSLGLNC